MDDEILAEYKQESYDKLVDQWHTNSSVSQIDWDRLYQANYKNNTLYPDATAKYALEERHSNLFETTFNANYNGQLLEKMRLTGGVDVKYSKAQYYKTMSDLLGANQWIDIDQFSERDFSSTDDIVQNDLNNPNRVIKEGDKFGYNNDINIIKAMA